MTKNEALKLALEALEANHFLIHGSETKGGLAFCMDGYYSGCFDIDSNDKQTNKAITAIKEALAQPNFCPICGKRLGTNDWDIHTCTPPQRTWVGLDEDEFVYFCAYVNHEKLSEIENVLRDKNESKN
jgi:hypothetical protein